MNEIWTPSQRNQIVKQTLHKARAGFLLKEGIPDFVYPPYWLAQNSSHPTNLSFCHFVLFKWCNVRLKAAQIGMNKKDILFTPFCQIIRKPNKTGEINQKWCKFWNQPHTVYLSDAEETLRLQLPLDSSILQM